MEQNQLRALIIAARIQSTYPHLAAPDLLKQLADALEYLYKEKYPNDKHPTTLP